MATRQSKTKPRAARAKTPTPATVEERPAAAPAAKAAKSGPIGIDFVGLAESSAQLYGEWARIMLGLGEREMPTKDPRFADPAWRDHPLYKRLG